MPEMFSDDFKSEISCLPWASSTLKMLKPLRSNNPNNLLITTYSLTIEFHFLLFPSRSTSKDNKVVVWAIIYWVCLPLMHPVFIDPSESWVSSSQGLTCFRGQPYGLTTEGNSLEGHRQLKNCNFMTSNFGSTIL